MSIGTAIAVGLGGAAGACLRAALSAATRRASAGDFPHAIYIVNTLGSTLLGLAIGIAGESLHPFLVTGFCGGLTTFSTFAVSAVDQIRSARFAASFANTILNFGGSIAGVVLGLYFAKMIQ